MRGQGNQLVAETGAVANREKGWGRDGTGEQRAAAGSARGGGGEREKGMVWLKGGYKHMCVSEAKAGGEVKER